jgi:putative iron-only hydrogenase system regulator
MDDRVAMISIVIQDAEAVEKVNSLLHEFAGYIIGRMGIPYRARGISLISVAMDAPGDAISSLSGKLGMIKGVSAKAVYARVPE